MVILLERRVEVVHAGVSEFLRDFVEKTDELTAEEKRLFLGENARRFYGFAPMSDPEKTVNMVE